MTIEVGDHVRIESGHVAGAWATGTVTKVEDRCWTHVRVESSCGHWPVVNLSGVSRFGTTKGGTIRRIPRPTPEVRGVALPVVEEPKQRTQCCKCGKWDTVSWECDCGGLGAAIKRENERRMEQISAPSPRRPTVEPILIDGLTAGQCLFRWWDNRALLERGAPLLYDMTPAQISVAKAEHAMETGQSESASLRAKLAESRERERNAVVMPIDAEDLPWR